MTEKPRLVTLCQRSQGRPDGIRDYTVRLVEALRATGMVDAQLAWRDDAGLWSWAELDATHREEDSGNGLLSTLASCDAILLQYNPFLYGRWGFAPWLPLTLLRLRLSRHRPRIAVMVHEPFVRMVNPSWALMGMWQRLQLAALRVSADLVFVSIEAWAKLLRIPPRKATSHLPVGSTIPDGRRFRNEQRQLIGADQESIVLGTFGQNMPGHRRWAWIVEATNSLARTGHRVTLLNLGADAAPVPGVDDGIVVHTPGDLPSDEVARWLSTVDVYLAPFQDGASTRRTTLMAAMQHGLPIVATDGPLTDSILRTSGGLRLVPTTGLVEFLLAVRHLADSPEDRRALGDRASDLYEKCFDWPVAAQRVLTMVGAPDKAERSVVMQPEAGAE